MVEDNARAGIFFHRSTNYAEAYGNTCKRNLEGDFGIVESTGVKVHNNWMEVCMDLRQVPNVLVSCRSTLQPLWAVEVVSGLFWPLLTRNPTAIVVLSAEVTVPGQIPPQYRANKLQLFCVTTAGRQVRHPPESRSSGKRRLRQ